jgi:hypothetical protein
VNHSRYRRSNSLRSPARTSDTALRLIACQPLVHIVEAPSGERKSLRGKALAAIGCVIGLLGAWGASRLLGSLLFQVEPFDPLVFGLAVATIFLLSLAASVIPARRAASILAR